MQSITPPPTTPGPSAGVSIIRTGRDGRLRFTPEQRPELLAAFDRGGQSAMSFARDHGVNFQTFIAWLRKRREHGIPAAGGPAFAEVLLESASCAAAPRRVTLPCGAVVDQPGRPGRAAALPLAARARARPRRRDRGRGLRSLKHGA